MSTPGTECQSPKSPQRTSLRFPPTPPTAAAELTALTNAVGNTVAGARPSYDSLLRILHISTRSRSTLQTSIASIDPVVVVPTLNIIPPTPALPSTSGLLPAFDMSTGRTQKRTRTKSLGRKSSDDFMGMQSRKSPHLSSPPSGSVSSIPSSPSGSEGSRASPASAFANVSSPDTPFTPSVSTPPARVHPFSPHPYREIRRRRSIGVLPTFPRLMITEKVWASMDIGTDVGVGRGRSTDSWERCHSGSTNS